MLRLPKKHSRIQIDTEPKPDAARILGEQSVGRAIGGGVAAVLVFGWLWAILSVQTGRVFPWMTIIIGAIVGVVVQRYGRGLDWRFPVIAAVIAFIGAYVEILMVAIAETGRYIEAEPWRVFAGLSKDTMENFFANTLSPVDHVYALCAAGVASFLAKRRLKRREVHALRTMPGAKR